MNSQEKLWSGQFGDSYHQRNSSVNRFNFWLRALRKMGPINSILEVGAGQGDNLVSLSTLYPKVHFFGVDVNAAAVEVMKERGLDAAAGAWPEISNNLPVYDLVITRGFLIHVADDALPETLEQIYLTSVKYVCIAEYYSPERRGVEYRGYNGALWCDDFAGKLMKTHPDLKLLDYGFDYHVEGGDDLTWFLLEKTK